MPNVMNDNAGEGAVREEPRVAGYEPPRIESVMTAEDVEREALYAGRPSQL